MKKSLTTILSGGALGAVATAALLWAAGPPSDASVAPSAQGMIAVLDRENGGFRTATAADTARYGQNNRANRAADEAARLTKRADGSESLQLDERYATYLTVRRSAEGTWFEQCRTEHDHVAAHVAQTRASVAPAVR